MWVFEKKGNLNWYCRVYHMYVYGYYHGIRPTKWGEVLIENKIFWIWGIIDCIYNYYLVPPTTTT